MDISELRAQGLEFNQKGPITLFQGKRMFEVPWDGVSGQDRHL